MHIMFTFHQSLTDFIKHWFIFSMMYAQGGRWGKNMLKEVISVAP